MGDLLGPPPKSDPPPASRMGDLLGPPPKETPFPGSRKYPPGIIWDYLTLSGGGWDYWVGFSGGFWGWEDTGEGRRARCSYGALIAD